MITKEQINELGFVYKQELVNKNKDFVNDKIKTTVSLSTDGKVEIIFNNYKKSWNNIESIDTMISIIKDIKKLISE